MVLIDKAALLNKIAKEVHYDSEHSLEMYAKMLSLINDAPDGIVRCQDCKYSDWWGPKGKEVLDCTRLDVPQVTPEWYCAWGERREDETD